LLPFIGDIADCVLSANQKMLGKWSAGWWLISMLQLSQWPTSAKRPGKENKTFKALADFSCCNESVVASFYYS